MPPFYPQLMHSHEFEMRHRHIGLLDPHMVHHVCLPSKTPPFYSQVLLSYLLEMRHLPLHIGLLNRRITHHLYQAKCLPLSTGPAQLLAWDAASPSPHWTSKLTYNTSFVPSKMSPLLSTGHAQLWVRDETSPKESADGPIGAVPFDPGKTSCYLVFCHSCHSLNLCCLVFGTRVFLFACVALFLALMSFFLLLVLPCFWHSCLSFCYLSYFVFGTCVFLLLLVLPCFWHSCLCFCYLCCLVYGTRVFCFGIRVFVFGTRAFLSITCFALFLALVPFFLLLKLFCYRHSCLCFWCSRLCLTIRATLFIFWVHELHCFSHSCLSF